MSQGKEWPLVPAPLPSLLVVCLALCLSAPALEAQSGGELVVPPDDPSIILVLERLKELEDEALPDEATDFREARELLKRKAKAGSLCSAAQMKRGNSRAECRPNVLGQAPCWLASDDTNKVVLKRPFAVFSGSRKISGLTITLLEEMLHCRQDIGKRDCDQFDAEIDASCRIVDLLSDSFLAGFPQKLREELKAEREKEFADKLSNEMKLAICLTGAMQ